MTIEQLRSIHKAQPFQPFVIFMADGRQLGVPHSEFLSYSPSGRTIVVQHGNDDWSVVDLLLVNEIRVTGRPASSLSPAG